MFGRPRAKQDLRSPLQMPKKMRHNSKKTPKWPSNHQDMPESRETFHQSADTYQTKEKRTSFADFCAYADSQYRYSVASWHRWIKSSATEWTIRHHSDLRWQSNRTPKCINRRRIYHIEIYPKLQQIGHRLPGHLPLQRDRHRGAPSEKSNFNAM